MLGKKFISLTAVFGLAIALILPQLVVAGTTGKIAGKVINEETGEPLPGVAVSIVGTKLGALTNEDGEYFILNVPVGAFTLRASLIGFAPVEVVNLDVSVDLTTYRDFSLSKKALELGKTIVVTAERPMIIKDKTASIRLVDAQEIQNMPTRGFQDVVGVQAGVVRFRDNPTNNPRGGPPQANSPHLYIRGGRPSEVAYFVDGFSTQDPLTGITTTIVNNNALKEIEVTTGGFNAEYGWVASGIVNATTKEGTEKYSGAVEAITDNVTTDNYDYNLYAANIGGPIPGLDGSTFFFSGERRWQRDRQPSALMDDDAVTQYFDDIRLPNNSLGGWSAQGKISFHASDNISLKLGGIYSLDNWQQYRHSFYFEPEHTPRYKDENLSLHMTWTHTLSPSTFYSAAASYYEVESIRGDGVYFDDIYAYGRPVFNPTFDQTGLFYSWDDIDGPTDTEYGWKIDSIFNTDDIAFDVDTTVTPWDTTYLIDTTVTPWDTTFIPDTLYADTSHLYVIGGDEGYVWDDFWHKKSNYYGFDFDLSSQITPQHLVKFGIDLQRHTIRFYRHLFPTRIGMGDLTGAWDGADHYGFDEKYNEIDTDDWRFDQKNPITFATYLQDKFEWQDLVINAGLRFDYFDSRALGVKSYERPLDPDFLNDDSASTMDRGDLTESEAETRMSPRLGVGFPVSDRTVVHLSYGKFFQRPDLERLYVGYDFYEYMVTGGFFYAFGNPNLKPEKTTAYEFGISHQLNDNTSFDITAYYKDVTDLTQIATISALGAAESYSMFFNEDFGTIKGLDFSLKMRRVHNIMLDLNYSLSWANGTGSFTQSNYNIAWTREKAPKLTAPLSFDQRHKLTGVIDIRAGREQGPMIGNIYPFENAGVNFIVNLGSGSPYSPSRLDADPVTLYSVSYTPAGPINSRNMPWTFRIDMKVNKTFTFGRTSFDLYVWVLNLLDRDNPLVVYESSGDPKATNWLNTETGQDFEQIYSEAHDTSNLTGRQKYELKQSDPSNYDIPRQIRFGVRLSF